MRFAATSAIRRPLQGQAARPGAAATGGTLVVFPVFDQCCAVAVDARTGERRWAFRTKGWMGATPAIYADSVYLGSQDRHLYAVDKRTGEERWKIRTGSRVSAGALSAGGHVYFGSCDAHLYGLGRADGAKAWAFETEHAEGRGAPIYGSPVVIGDTIYLGAMAGKVYAIARETGELRWSVAPMPGSEINSDLRTDGERLFVTTRRDIDGKGESVAIAVELP
jgi:outer membrane protein assembly factor BamB